MRFCARPCLALTVAALAARPLSAQEGRAAPADSAGTAPQSATPRTRGGLNFLLVVGSAPETGIVGGVTALRVHRSAADSATRPSSDQIYVAYTQKHQLRAFLETDRWTAGNDWRFGGGVEFSRFPLPFFGFGMDTPEDDEEWYTPRTVSFKLNGQRQLVRGLFIGTGYRFAHTKILELEAGRALDAGGIEGIEGGDLAAASATTIWDTRENLFAPRRGTLAQASASVSATAVGSDFTFTRYVLDARRYISLGGAQVIALQGTVEATRGSAPFDQLSLLGGPTIMRGYVRGRYRDRDLVAAQIEYRRPIIGRLGGALFAGTGAVANTFTDVRSDDLVPSYGLGLRWLLIPRERTAIRLDYGRGRGSSGLYVGLNEAF